MEVSTYKLISEPTAPATSVAAASNEADSSMPVIQPRPLSSFNISMNSNVAPSYQEPEPVQIAPVPQSNAEKFHEYLRAKRMVTDEQLARYADRIVYSKPRNGLHANLYRKLDDVDFDEEDFREEQRAERIKLGSTAGKMMLASSLLGLVLTVMNG